MRLLIFLALLGPVATDRCGDVDEKETCMVICKAKLGKRPFMVEVLGKTGADQWRTCACYMDRKVVVDDLPTPVEKEKP